jgi:hypothetical protein
MEEITESEPSEVITPDTQNATYFDPNDCEAPMKVPNDRTVDYNRLRLYNRNTWTDRREENKEVTHRQDNLAIYDAISSHVELNSYQKSQGRKLFDRLDLGDIGKSARLVAFGVCVVVANDDVPGGSRYHPNMKNPSGLFHSLSQELGFEKNQLLSIIGIINSRRM